MGTTENTSRGPADTVGQPAEALRLVDNPVFELLLQTYAYKISRQLQLLITYNIDSASISIILGCMFHALFNYLCISMRKLSGFICMIRVGTYRLS